MGNGRCPGLKIEVMGKWEGDSRCPHGKLGVVVKLSGGAVES